MPSLEDPITLPCGAVLKNRLCKAAMTEGLADEYGQATEQHERLYKGKSPAEPTILRLQRLTSDKNGQRVDAASSLLETSKLTGDTWNARVTSVLMVNKAKWQ